MKKDEEEERRIWDCGSPLYDSFEVATVGHLIDRHALALVSPGGSMRFPATVSKVSLSGQRSSSEKMIMGSGVGAVSKLLRMKLWKRKGKKSRRAKGGFYGLCVTVGF